jgi:hypothetical protein
MNNIRYRLYKCSNASDMKKMEKKFKDMFHDMKSTNINNANAMKIEVSK